MAIRPGKVWNGTGWDDIGDARMLTHDHSGGANGAAVAGAMPVGAVTPYAGATAPTGWLLCAGQTVPAADYPALYAVIGTTYGGNSTNFALPDLRGRVVAGVDNMGGTDAGRLDWANTLGTAGGAQTHTLTTAEMPSHSHDRQEIRTNAIAHNPGKYIASAAGTVFYTNEGTGYTGDSLGTEPTGGGGAHLNMQPTMLLNYIIRAL